MSENLVSCIIPFFNSTETIEACLESVSKITHKNFELVLVDDGSTDNSVQKVEKFLSKFSVNDLHRKLLILPVNKGASYAKNIGIKNIKGDFFFFADADDLQYPERISIPLKYLLENPDVDIVYFDCNIFREETGPSISYTRGFPTDMNNGDLLIHQMKRNHLWSGMFLARSSVKDLFNVNLNSGVDYEWFFKLYFNCRTIHFIRDPLLHYRVHNKNISNNYSDSHQNVIKILKSFENDFQNLRSSLPEDISLEAFDLALVWVHINLTNFHEALKLLKNLNKHDSFFEKTFLHGVCLVKLGETIQASFKFKELTTKYPRKCEAWNNLAYSQACTGLSIETIAKTFERSYSINPDFYDARHNLEQISKRQTRDLRLTTFPLRETLIHTNHFKTSIKG
jgi:glycosyltransferase involved in cell wall biosynthesis